MAKRMCMALEHSSFRECSLTLLMLGWWKLVSSLLLMPVYEHSQWMKILQESVVPSLCFFDGFTLNLCLG